MKSAEGSPPESDSEGGLASHMTGFIDRDLPVALGVRIPSVDRGTLASGEPNGTASAGGQASRISVVAKGHRHRGARSMGRFPFKAAVNRLVREEARERLYAENTLAERRRKMHLVGEIAEGSYDRGEVTTSNPEKMTKEDVAVVIGAITRGFRRGLPTRSRCPATTSKMIRLFDTVLLSCGNGAVSELRVRKKALFPRVGLYGNIRTLSTGEWTRLISGVWEVDDPWWNVVARAAIMVYSTTGLRVGELRTQRADGIDLDNERIYVSHPKGEGRWTKSGEARPLMPEAVPLLRDYLEIRGDELAKRGIDPDSVPWLFPYFKQEGTVSEWHDAQWRKMMDKVRQESGVDFTSKVLRPTFAQKAVDNGNDPQNPDGMAVAIGQISKCLGHKKTATTETYYASLSKETAFARVSRAWKPLWETPQLEDLQNSIRGD